MATIIFWSIIISDQGFDTLMLAGIPLSMLPIGISCSIVIILTILPFFWNSDKANRDNEVVFKRYFPYYAITSFSICLYGFILVTEVYFFWFSAFFTSLQAWIWFTKSNTKTTKHETKKTSI
ncbi:hypothetical protein [Seonamhaeicola marinus]|uniref:Uncharacterized protein n=1 Tax=Seonamhaeicola marinus TaxID=1912246 RepID=A0A5D0IT77_9FLAO|nr:hypothetical protein [Seonamhaeicola marinus]TYA86804.1 hypothetical protein FUA24_04560 [Seonamhaeicola marinus]